MKGKELLLFVATLSISLVVAEILLRYLVDLPLPQPLPQVRYDYHPTRRFTLRPDQQSFTYSAVATLDKAGFRSDGKNQLPATNCEITIFALGDLFAFGMGVADHETWPAQFER